jgi:hypothetical protein
VRLAEKVAGRATSWIGDGSCRDGGAKRDHMVSSSDAVDDLEVPAAMRVSGDTPEST